MILYEVLYILLYFYTFILLYFYTFILLYFYTFILLYFYTFILLYFYTLYFAKALFVFVKTHISINFKEFSSFMFVTNIIK